MLRRSRTYTYTKLYMVIFAYFDCRSDDDASVSFIFGHMALIHPRGFNIAIPQDDIVFHKSLSYNSTKSAPPNPPSKTSWLSRLLNHIPGYPWIKHKIGTFIYGPTYAMTPTQLRAYKSAEAQKEHIASFKANLEADFKVAKYTALQHPTFYWHKYVDAFEKGTDERKMGILVFVLANKADKGDYYGKTGRWRHKIDEELEDFGLTLEPEGSVKKQIQGHGAPEMKGRKVGEETMRLTGQRKELLENLERTVAGFDISHLREREKTRKARASRRLLLIPKERDLVQPHFN